MLLYDMYILIPSIIIETKEIRLALVTRFDLFHCQLRGFTRGETIFNSLIPVNKNFLYHHIWYVNYHDFGVQLSIEKYLVINYIRGGSIDISYMVYSQLLPYGYSNIEFG